jgi:hypothetical protein
MKDSLKGRMSAMKSAEKALELGDRLSQIKANKK